jgi:Putative beta barrel porin-7 (BBP7)
MRGMSIACAALLLGSSAAHAQWNNGSAGTTGVPYFSPAYPAGPPPGYAPAMPFFPYRGGPEYAGPAPPADPNAGAPAESHPQRDNTPTWDKNCYAQADYLLWLVKNGPSPLPLAALGAVGQPLFGGDNFDYGLFNGLRVSVGQWCGEDGQIGVEFRGLILEQRTDSFRTQSAADGLPVLTRPFLDALDGGPSALVVSSPALASGAIAVTTNSQLWGGEINGLWRLAESEGLRWHLLGGFRHFSLEEDLSVVSVSRLPAGRTAPFAGGALTGPASLVVADRFFAASHFYGGQFGSQLEWQSGRLIARLSGQVALGTTRQIADQTGGSVGAPAAGLARFAAGGLLVTPTNTGHFATDRFAVLPEVGAQVGYQFTRHMAAFVGYNFLYLSSVVRAGDQIDPVVNPRQLPASLQFGTPGGPARPAVLLNPTGFWAQGVNFGLVRRY